MSTFIKRRMSIFSGFESTRHDQASSGHLNNSTENVVEGCPDINIETMEVKKKSKKSRWISTGLYNNGETNQKCNFTYFLLYFNFYIQSETFIICKTDFENTYCSIFLM